jgi:hypothetical protein
MPTMWPSRVVRIHDECLLCSCFFFRTAVSYRSLHATLCMTVTRVARGRNSRAALSLPRAVDDSLPAAHSWRPNVHNGRNRADFPFQHAILRSLVSAVLFLILATVFETHMATSARMSRVDNVHYGDLCSFRAFSQPSHHDEHQVSSRAPPVERGLFSGAYKTGGFFRSVQGRIHSARKTNTLHTERLSMREVEHK